MITGEYKGASLGTLAVGLAVAVAAVAWLGFGDDDVDEPAPPSTAETVAAFPEGAIDGPVMRHLPPLGEESEAAEIRGTLVLEGDCLLVDSPWGERYPIVWPAGTTWDPAGEAVVLHSGERLAVGSDIQGGGGYSGASGLSASLGDEAAALAEMCVEGEFEEVAYLGNTPDAVRPG